MTLYPPITKLSGSHRLAILACILQSASTIGHLNRGSIESRWKDDYATQRASIGIYDLIDAENIRSRKIARAVDNENFELAKTLSTNETSPVAVINRLLRLSDMPIEISIKEGAEVFASKNGSPPYSIAELSDGERNALLLAADVLTVEKNQLIVIDEPERHLHRSIISPLLTLLFSERKDCTFVVSTHDVMLPLDNPSAHTLLIRNCTYTGSQVTNWEADIVGPETAIEEDIRRDILGARRKILFVEGTENSLDKPLYSLIFPNVSIIPKENCREVEHAVGSIRDASEVHWLNAFGIVDNDQRPEDELESLKEKGVYALPVFSVESIYYHPKIQEFVAHAHAKVTGENEQGLLAKARSETIKAVEPHVQRLSERAAMQSIRKEFFRHLPRQSDISTERTIEVSINVESTVAEERNRLGNALRSGNIEEIISRYPVRETPALDKISKELGFQNCQQYEGAVRTLLINDPDALIFVRSLFDTLVSNIR